MFETSGYMLSYIVLGNIFLIIVVVILVTRLFMYKKDKIHTIKILKESLDETHLNDAEVIEKYGQSVDDLHKFVRKNKSDKNLRKKLIHAGWHKDVVDKFFKN